MQVSAPPHDRLQRRRRQLRTRRPGRPASVYRHLFHAASDALLVLDPATERVLEANAQADVLYGFDAGGLVGRCIRDFTQDPDRGETLIHSMLADGGRRQFETLQYRADGTPLHLLVDAVLVDYDGRRAILSTNRDLAAWRQTTTALAHRLRLEETLVQITQYLVSGDLALDVVLERLADALGVQRAALYEMDDADALTLVHGWHLHGAPAPDTPPPCLQPGRLRRGEIVAVRDAARADDPRVREALRARGTTALLLVPMRCPDHVGLLAFESAAGPHPWAPEDSRMLQVAAGLLSSALRRAETERSLVRSETRYREIADHIDEAFWLRDVAADRIVYVSPYFATLWGRPVPPLDDVADVWLESIHPDDRPRVAAARQRAPLGGFDETYRIRRPDGEVRWVQDRSFTVDDADGRPIRVAGIVADVTEQLATERLLHRHDELLQAVAGASNMLLSDPDVDQAVCRAFELIGRATDVDRVYLFENHVDPASGTLLSSQRYEWAQDEVAPQIDNPVLQDVPYQELAPWWLDELLAGRAIAGPVRAMPSPERELLAEQDIRSVLAVPIVIDGDLWGFVGFDDCRHERTWTPTEQHILTAAAGSIVRKLLRQRDRTALGESERRFRQIVETISELFWMRDAVRGDMLYVSPAFEAIWGYPVDDLHADPGLWMASIHPDDRARVAAAAAPEHASTPVEIEYRIVHADGGTRWIHDRVYPIHDDDGTLVRLIGVAADVTERKRIEQELLTQRDFTQRILDTSPNPIFVKDAAGRMLTVNAAVEHLTGVPADRLVGRSVASFSTGSVPEHETTDRAVLERGESVRVEQTFRHTDGHVRWFETYKVPLRLPDGQRGLLGIAQDITDRRAAEQALRRSRDQYRDVVESVRDVVFQTDLDGRWTFLNPAWTESLGHALEESLGRPFLDFVHPDDHARCVERFEPVLKGTESAFRLEVRYLTADGRRRWMEVYARLLLDDRQRVVGVAGTLHDVHERRRAMQALEQALAHERELGQLKSRFVSMASHELRTPLTAIRSSAEILQRFGDRWDAERRSTLYGRIQDNIEHMGGLIDDVLLLGRAHSGQLPFDPAPVDVAGFARQLVGELSSTASGPARVTPELPDAPITAEVDARLLRLVLTNLVTNAVKYGGRTAPVELRLTESASHVVFEVEDHGIGIPAADLPRLFEPFHRAGNVGARPGTGLGLSIVQRAVETHGGTIDVHSEEDLGTVFTVRLPRFASTPAPPAVPDPPVPDPPPAP